MLKKASWQNFSSIALISSYGTLKLDFFTAAIKMRHIGKVKWKEVCDVIVLTLSAVCITRLYIIRNKKFVKLICFNMPSTRCVVQDCSNKSDKSTGVSLHKSPTDESLRRIWAKFVQTKREF